MVAIPVIDISPLVSNSPDAGTVAATIGRACRETGFFYVVEHGVTPETMETVFAMSRAFFAQPIAEKQKAASPDRPATAAGSSSATRSSIPASPMT